MEKSVVVVDMDNTLFDTARFIGDVSDQIKMNAGIDQTAFLSQLQNYYKMGPPGFRHYDFFEHIRSLGLSPKEIELLLEETLRESDYAFPDSEKFIDFIKNQIKPDLVFILTYGESRFQQLKYRCSSLIGKIACVDTLRSKGEFLSSNFTSHKGQIIDDKEIPDLPNEFQHIWISRGGLTSTEGKHSSLDEIIKNWHKITSE